MNGCAGKKGAEMRFRALLGVVLGLLGSQGPAALATKVRVSFQSDDIFLTMRSGAPAGFAAEILALVAQREGFELEYVDADLSSASGLVESLQKGTADIAVGPLAITAERLQHVDFSDVIFPSQVRLFGSAKAPVTGLEDVAGMRVGVIAGSIVERALGTCGCEIVRFESGSTEEMAAQVHRGELAALASTTDVVLPRLTVGSYRGLQMGPALGSSLELAFAVQKGSPLKQQLDRTIRDLKRSKIFYRLVGQYFGQEAVAIFQAGRGHEESP